MPIRNNLLSSPLHLFLLLLLSTLPYFGTITHDWHLDDPVNILDNTPLHIKDLNVNTLINTFYAYPGEPGKLFRPVANFSFALNWFWGQGQTSGYHLANITIHCLTTIALYLCCLLLLRSPATARHNLKNPQLSALLAASLWTLAPIHTQSVTYIVQRMAQLATLFSITAILFFLLARLSTVTKKRFLFSCCFLACALLALGSKENSILLLLSVPLIEGIFFSQKKIRNFAEKISPIWWAIIFLIALTVIGFILSQFSTRYDHRSFTLIERLLTEPRILLFYLSQILFPAASRLSIEHNIIVSTSLFTPWSTLPAILSCIGLLFFSFLRIRTKPLLSFAILFFFINHLVESTFIPLELLYEHRNYLPSLFLFLPVSVFIVNFLSDCTEKKPQRQQTVIITLCIGFLLFSGISTIKRNTAWETEESLWQDALSKAPDSARSRINLAASYITKGQHKEALALLEQTKGLSGATKNRIPAIVLHLKGSIAYKEGDIKQAVGYLQQAFFLRSDYSTVVYKLIALLVEQQRYEEGLSMISERYEEKKEPQLLLIKAALLLRLNKPSESLDTYQAARPFFPGATSITAGQGKAMSLLGHYNQADTILDWAVKNNEPDSILLRIENSLRAGNAKQASQVLKLLIQSVPLNALLQAIESPQTGAFQIPFDHVLLKGALLDTVDNMTTTSSPQNSKTN